MLLMGGVSRRAAFVEGLGAQRGASFNRTLVRHSPLPFFVCCVTAPKDLTQLAALVFGVGSAALCPCPHRGLLGGPSLGAFFLSGRVEDSLTVNTYRTPKVNEYTGSLRVVGRDACGLSIMRC